MQLSPVNSGISLILIWQSDRTCQTTTGALNIVSNTRFRLIEDGEKPFRQSQNKNKITLWGF